MAAHRDYIEKFQAIELSQELTTTRTHLTLFLFSDCLEVCPSKSIRFDLFPRLFQITKLRASTWKAPGMKAAKSYKHVALIPLSDIRSLVDINSPALSIDGKFSLFIIPRRMSVFLETEQFGIICSIEGQIRQLIFRIINGNNSTNSSKSNFTDSMSSLSSISTLSSCTRQGNNKTDVLYYLSKAISDDRCLLDKVDQSVIQTSNRITPF